MEFCQSVANILECLLSTERLNGGIGVVEIDENNKDDVEQLLKNLLITSESAIQSKEEDYFISFLDEMEDQILRENTLIRELDQIIEGVDTERLFLQYQPIIDIDSNKISAFEALARLDSEKFGNISPLEFISIAEKTKQIIPLGREIIVEAFEFLKTLNNKGFDDIDMSINISAIQLLRRDFVKTVIELMEEMEINPENICFEITETTFASNYKQINKILGELKDYGIKIAIDDFGTGYSSIFRLRELNANYIKIDKYFIDKLLVLDPEEAITGDIISMAHRIGCLVIAEGVETEEQRQYLEDNGCDKIQGYLIARPLYEDMALQLLERQMEKMVV